MSNMAATLNIVRVFGLSVPSGNIETKDVRNFRGCLIFLRDRNDHQMLLHLDCGPSLSVLLAQHLASGDSTSCLEI